MCRFCLNVNLRFAGLVFRLVRQQQVKRLWPGNSGVFECVWQRDVKSETTC